MTPGAPWRRVRWPGRAASIALIGLLAGAAAWAGEQAAAPDGPPQEPLVIASATLITPTAAGPREVALPHMLAEADLPPGGGRVRYRLALPLAARPTAPLAIWLPRVSLSGALRVNGRDIGACAAVALEQARCLHQPQLFEPPPEVWRAGANEIEVEVYGNSRQSSGLSRVTVGPTGLVQPLQAARWFGQVELLHGLTWALVAVSLLSFGAAAMLRDRGIYLWFGAAGIVNALCNLNFLITVPPVGTELYSWFTYSIRIVSVPLFMLALLAFFGQRRPWAQRALVGCIVLMPVAVWLSGNSRTVVQLLYLPFFPAGALAFGAAAVWAWRSRKREQMFMAGVMMTLLMAAFWDYAKLRGATAFESIYLIPYSYTLTLLLMGSVLMSLLGRALEAQRSLALTLEQQVADREAELRRAYAGLLTLEQARIRDEEREELLAHMHDGVGSQLTSARARLASGEIEPGEAAELLRECSDDLRLVVDTLGGESRDLAHAVAAFRHRLSTRLAATPLQVRWQVAIDGAPGLPQRAVLQVMRVLQEASNNAILHAQASSLSLVVEWQPASAGAAAGLRVAVEDDGVGFVPEQLRHSSGLRNLHQRARALGGRLDIDSRPGHGTRVTLHWAPEAAGRA